MPNLCRRLKPQAERFDIQFNGYGPALIETTNYVRALWLMLIDPSTEEKLRAESRSLKNRKRTNFDGIPTEL